MSQDFVIPVSRDDLLVESRSAYYVRRMHLPSAITARLEEANEALSSAGYLSITAHFDTLFSALSHFAEELDQPTKRKAWKTSIKWLESLCSSLDAMLDQGDMSYQEKKRHCTAIKMLCYLTTQFIETFMKPASMTIATQKKRGQKTAANRGNAASWDEARDRGLHCIEQMLEMDRKRLWDPPILEENLVTCVTSCCCKLLENSETVRKRGAKEHIFHILGIAISKCNHCMGATLKIIQLLQDFEHLCIPLAEAVEYFGRQLEAKTIVVELIREMGSLDPQDMSRDTSGTRALATFVAEIGERLPDIVLSIISSLLPHLDGENYSLRNSVLVTIGAIVAQVLSEPSVDDVAKATRDEFLNKLMEHIYDVNAFVRSKCLQVWLNLFKKQAIPLATQQCLVPKIVDRLQDKLSNVRKYSIQFLTTFPCGNPFKSSQIVERTSEERCRRGAERFDVIDSSTRRFREGE
ncbi:condensin complex subunit 1-like [Oscarella lobularis]|uniref:condensin complex subunit 1-like n=1 Tax=Oscarella lobularis TaxID=121494 RepID=UPI0033137C6B